MAGVEYRVLVQEILKDVRNARPTEITVVELGGDSADGRGVRTTGEPPVRLRPNGNSILFLSVWPAVNGYAIVSGGAFPVENDEVVIPNGVEAMKTASFGGKASLPREEFVALVKKAAGR
jgi:hypothetical protein